MSQNNGGFRRTLMFFFPPPIEGFLLIDANHLTAEEADFATGGSLADAADALNARLLGWLPPFNRGGMYVIAGWFVFTGLQTFRTGTAHTADHGRWALRPVVFGRCGIQS